jgi:predicted PurR-regulated permease PerM
MEGRMSKVDTDPVRMMVVLAAGVVLIGGLKAASGIVVPFLVAAFLAMLAWPSIVYLHHSRFPDLLAFPTVIAVVIGGIVGVGYYIGYAVNNFVARIPSYRKQFIEQFEAVVSGFNSFSSRFGVELSGATVNELIHPEQFFGYIGGTIGTLGNILSNSFLVVLVFAFLLGEFRILPGKARVALNDPDADLSRFARITGDVQKYIGVKTVVSAITGLVAGIGCWIVGVPFAPLWGIIAFFLNYIPSLGSIIAAVPPALLAFVILGTGPMITILIIYFVINTAMGNIIEPRWQGETLGLSTFIVFTSLIFWGWVLGPVGMVLSVPLTMVLKIAMENREDLRWIAIMLGGEQEVSEEADTSVPVEPQAG